MHTHIPKLNEDISIRVINISPRLRTVSDSCMLCSRPFIKVMNMLTVSSELHVLSLYKHI